MPRRLPPVAESMPLRHPTKLRGRPVVLGACTERVRRGRLHSIAPSHRTRPLPDSSVLSPCATDIAHALQPSCYAMLSSHAPSRVLTAVDMSAGPSRSRYVARAYPLRVVAVGLRERAAAGSVRRAPRAGASHGLAISARKMHRIIACNAHRMACKGQPSRTMCTARRKEHSQMWRASANI